MRVVKFCTGALFLVVAGCEATGDLVDNRRCDVVEYVEGDGCRGWVVLEGLTPHVPPSGMEDVTCVDSWGSSAPLRAPAWVFTTPLDPGDWHEPVVRALPSGGAVLVTQSTIRWIDSLGEEDTVAAHDACETDPCDYAVEVRESDGHVMLAAGVDDGVRLWEFANQALHDEVAFAVQGGSLEVVEVFEIPSGGWLIVGGNDVGGVAFYLHVGADLELVDLESWQTPSDAEVSVAAFDGHQALVGADRSFYTFEIPGTGVTPAGTTTQWYHAAVGSPDGFRLLRIDFEAGNGVSVEKWGDPSWVHMYDRVGGPDLLSQISANEDLLAIAGGDPIWWMPPVLFFEQAITQFWQPFVLVFDSSGEPQWMSRLAIAGHVTSIDVGTDHIVAAGTSRTPCGDDEDWDFVQAWPR